MSNRLAAETSPYLLQHANNPVDWYPWGPEALAKAETEAKPILLSVGYAACHWCHVMERESFENEDTAALMNEHFVSIKVDREERPDIDGIYMDAVQAMTHRGGWPMTVFLTPEGAPFYAGTYFPDEPRHGMPSFRQVLHGVADAWRDKRTDITEQAATIVTAIEHAGTAAAGGDEGLDGDTLRNAVEGLRGSFDPEWGGFGGAPKFPQAMALEVLFRAHARGVDGALEMATFTLDKMADGGMNDQVGGGFHRYSVDRQWHVPHFEKMLYDNALLVPAYTHGWQLTGDVRYRRVVRSTIDYLLREMRHPDGGFFSSQDADSEGVEGKFFVWDWDALLAAAGEDVAAYLGARANGNWEGANVLWTPMPAAKVAEHLGLGVGELLGKVETARAKLFDIREERIRPATDDKILAAWNGLAIAALAEAGKVFEEPRYVDAAADAAAFVLEELRDPSGRLLRSWRDGRAGRPGYSDDYALMADGCVTLFEATGDERWFVAARDLCDEMITLFEDVEHGGFFQTGSDAEALVIRPKELFDNAVPSGNSAAASVLLRLSLFTGEASYEERAVRALRAVGAHMTQAPVGFGRALTAMDTYAGPSPEIAIVGSIAEPREALAREVWSRYVPGRVLAVAGGDTSGSEVPLLRGRSSLDPEPAAYVCERFVCARPVSDPEALAALL